jgi:hypothetical protein
VGGNNKMWSFLSSNCSFFLIIVLGTDVLKRVHKCHSAIFLFTSALASKNFSLKSVGRNPLLYYVPEILISLINIVMVPSP